MTIGMQLFDGLLQQTTSSSRMLRMVRDDARKESVEAIRAIERRLVEALDGDVIRGLPNLVPDGEAFRAARINNTNNKYGSGDRLPLDGRTVMVLNERGFLMMAKRDETAFGAYAVTWAVTDEDLRTEILEPYKREVEKALQTHVTRAERTARNYEKIRGLAERLKSAVQ